MMDATGVWALLMAGAFVVLALVGLAVLAERPRGPRPDRSRLRAEAEELSAHADAVQADATAAADAATEARTRVTEAERDRDAAWAAQEESDRAYREALRVAEEGRAAVEAARAGRSGSPLAGTEPDRERTVSRAALSAYRRGDISVDELREVFRRAGDWDPVQDERERAVDRRRVELAAARRAHDRAAAAVRRAEQAARVAEVAAEALLGEATESAAEAQEALLALERPTERRRRPAR